MRIDNCCYLCGANSPQVLFPVSYKSKRCGSENIVICRNCGLVYKHPVEPENEILHYMEADHWVDPYFDKKLSGTADYVHNEFESIIKKNGTIVDVGAAAGNLLFHIGKHFPSAVLIGVEPSANACKSAREKNKRITMLWGTLEDINVECGSVDLVTAIGVDYLFMDHTEALKKIHGMLKDNGYLYIERNVFLNSRAYRSSTIDLAEDLFCKNSMTKTWFTEDQMSLQLSKFFKVEKINRFVANVIRGHENRHCGWVCKKSNINLGISIPSVYKENLAYVRKLLRNK